MEARARANEMTVLAFMATAVMLFAAFTAAYLIRRTGVDWQPISIPNILWYNTVIVLASSVTAEFARRTSRRWWLDVTAVLGLLFLAGQLMAWRSLASTGVFLPTYPHSSFFYVLTAVHGVHLLGGIVALVYTTVRRRNLGLCVTYWHFVDLVWVFVFGCFYLI